MSIANASQRQAANLSAGARFNERHVDRYAVQPTAYIGWKGLLDRSLAALLIIPGLPLIGLLVLLIRLTSKGPGMYQQLRTGKDGKHFMMLKLRSMVCDAEAKTGPVWTTGADPRITSLGHVLRKLHLDELPQLFNVLRGEMSLIGPRPERPEFVEVLAGEINHYTERLQTLPGITGLAQINLPPDTDLDSVRRKLCLDIEYIRTAGAILDLRILVCTSMRIVGVRGDAAMRLMHLQREVKLDQVNGSAPSFTPESAPTPEALKPSERKDQPCPQGCQDRDRLVLAAKKPR